jgi:heat shock protein HslJ
MKNLIIFAFILCLFSSCLEKIDPAKLANTKWELTEMSGSTLPANAKATLNFGDSLRVSGKSFCNNYGGKAEISGNKVALKNIFGTKMFCQETATAENTYLTALNQVNAAKLNGGKLQLLNGDKTLLVFTQSN